MPDVGRQPVAASVSEPVSLQAARRRPWAKVAREHGHGQIETHVTDGEKSDLPDVSFDAVICRLGLMYLPHPGAALRK